MSKLIVLLDSSTKSSSKSKYGNSSYAWLAYWEGASFVAKASLSFLKKEGPNKTFYEGVLDVLRSCRCLCHKGDELCIYGDCLLVINHVNSTHPKSDGELMPFYNQASKIMSEYRCFITIKHINRGNPKYKVVDQISKTGMDWLKTQTSKFFTRP